MSVLVKICGITNEADALAAVEAGADALGFVFFESSPRHITHADAAAFIHRLPPYVVKVGVFVDAPADEVVNAIRQCGLNVLQFHGAEDPDYCLQFGLMTMKAFRVRDAASLEELTRFRTDAWLLDAYVAGQAGGTGETFNWELARAAQGRGRPIFLAGGLTPENVAAAVKQVQPYGVDVSSGVEATPGKKDHAKVNAFIKAAKEAQGH